MPIRAHCQSVLSSALHDLRSTRLNVSYARVQSLASLRPLSHAGTVLPTQRATLGIALWNGGFRMHSNSAEAPRPGKKRRSGGEVVAMASAQDTGSNKVPHTVGATVRVTGLTLTDHTFELPLDHTGEMPGTIKVFVREVVATNRAGDTKLPYLVYFTGGPGFESPRPAELGGWIACATEKYRVLLLDQRGTGRSTPITTASVLAQGTPEQQAAYLANFRADSIVKDMEAIRRSWLSESIKLTTLGQSFGGFCTLTYLSMYPEGLERSLVTGGIPPVAPGCAADLVYSHLIKRVLAQNVKYYQRFPGDVEQIGKVVKYIEAKGGRVPLPGGGDLTPQGLQWLGINLGFAGGMESLHFFFETAFDGTGELSHIFKRSYENMLNVDTNPIYALLHESIYCQGAASRWSASRVVHERSADFDAVAAANEGRPVLMTGEMIFPWMFDDIASLRPLKEAANLLAAKSDWPPLYDVEVLRRNEVPVAAAAYYEDMYVEMALSQQTANEIKGIRLWVTSEYMHSGVREDGPRIFSRLLAMTRDELPIR